MAFSAVVNDQAYLKMGIMGLQGAGKTYTAVEVAIGLRQLLESRGLPGGEEPVCMLDTEVGSSWRAKRFVDAGIPFEVDKTRAFKDLVPAVEYVAEKKAVLIIDSVTAFWNELTESYARKKGRKRGLMFQDWAALKSMWRRFTDALVNSTSHIVMCGRQGYEYNYFEDDDGKKQLEKTGLRMKAEAETGYEPSLLIVMQRHQELDDRNRIERVYRTAYVLKDRAVLLDGKTFENPTFEDFMPHVECLNLGGEHLGVDSTRSSESMIERDDQYRLEQQQRAIVLEEISELIKKHHPSQSTDDKRARGDLMEQFISTRSWKKVETLPLLDLKQAHNAIHLHLEGSRVYPELAPAEGAFLSQSK